MEDVEFKRILLVKDNLKFQEILADALRNSAFRVDVSNNCEHAKRHLNAYYYDLAILSINDKDALVWEFLDEVIETRDMPLIAIKSADPSDELEAAFKKYEQYFEKILKKPFGKAEFLDAVKDILD